MLKGNLSQRLRPIKLAFIVDPNDKERILRILKINSTVWGGHFNPIIPNQQLKSGIWKKRAENRKMEELIRDYISNFNPDYVVDATGSDQFAMLYHQATVSLDHYETHLKNGYGIGIKMDVFYDKLFKEQQIDPTLEKLRMVVPLIEKDESEIFLTSIFGQELKSKKNRGGNQLVQKFKPELYSFNLENYLSYYRSPIWTYRRLTGFNLNSAKWNSYGSTIALYVLDANSVMDVIEFWNLRANGWYVLPITVKDTSIDIEKIKSTLRESLKANNVDMPGTIEVKVIKASSLNEDAFLSFWNLSSRESSEFYFPIMMDLPRLWDSNKWAEDSVVCAEIWYDNSDTAFTFENGEITFNALEVELPDSYRSFYEVKYAIDVTTLNNHGQLDFPEIFPKRIDNLKGFYNARYFSHRVSRMGYTILNSFRGSQLESFRLTKSIDLFIPWASMNGYDLKISSAGKIAERMFKHFRHTYQIRRTIGRKGAINLLTDITGYGIEGNSLEQKIKRMFNEGKGNKISSGYIRELVDNNILQAGFSFTCPECAQKSWYPLTDLNYKLDCGKCLFEFEPPAWEYREFNLSYRPIGTFSLPRKSSGAYPILFTYLFFKENQRFKSTTIFSFDLINKKSRKQMEVDMAMFVQRKNRLKDLEGLILVEAKTFASFKAADIQRMKTIGRKFSDAVLVFATLKEKLNSTEKKHIKKLIEYNLHKKQNYKNFNEIIVLTANELLTHEQIQYKLDDDLTQTFSTILHTKGELTAIAKISQKLNLDL